MKQAQEVVQRRNNLIYKRLTDVIRRRGEESGDVTMKHVYNTIIYEGTEDREVGGGGARAFCPYLYGLFRDTYIHQFMGSEKAGWRTFRA